MADTKQERFPDYPIFKGLQRPLEFFGLQDATSTGRQPPQEEPLRVSSSATASSVSWQDSCC